MFEGGSVSSIGIAWGPIYGVTPALRLPLIGSLWGPLRAPSAKFPLITWRCGGLLGAAGGLGLILEHSHR